MREAGTADLVSIVIPVFNGADYLAQAIDSALAQSWPRTEVIVVDDGSDDGGRTRAVALSYGDRIRLITKPNGGVASALNAGIAAMRGRWFSWLSHDDLYLPGKVETQLRALLATDGDAIAFSDFALMDADGGPLAVQDCTGGFDPDQPLWAVFEGRLNGCAMMLPRAVLEEAGGFDPGLPTTQDYALWFRLLRRHRLLPVPGVLVRQRTHAAQGSRDARHRVEAGLLWAEMIGSVTPEEMRRHAANDLAFLRRVARGAGAATYPGAGEAVQARIADRLRAERAGLVWVADGPGATGEGPHRALASLAAAGLGVAGAAIADAASGARASLGLRRVAGPGAPVLRLFPSEPAGALLHAAATLDAAMVLFAEEATALPPARLREAAAMIAAGEADGVLVAGDEADPAGALPAALRGALLSMEAIRAALARAEALPGTDAGAALGLVARLALLPAAAPDQPPSAQAPVVPAPYAMIAGAGAEPVQPVVLSRTGRSLVLLGERIHAGLPRSRGWIGPAVAWIVGAAGRVDRDAYLAANADVRAAGADPHLHYLLHGWREGRLPAPRPVGTEADGQATALPAEAKPLPSIAPQAGPCRLLVLHGIGGGTRRYAELRAEVLRRQGTGSLFAWGFGDSELVIEGLSGHDGPLSIPIERGLDEAAALLRGLNLDRVEVLHTIGLDKAIVPLLAALGVPYDVVLLDYHLIATQPHLIDGAGLTAALGDGEEALRGLLRPAPHPVLAGAERVLACSRDLAARAMRLVPGLTVTAVQTPERPVPEAFRVTPPAPIGAGETLRVLFLGGLAPHKGSEVLADAAGEAARRGLPIEFHQLGHLHVPLPPRQRHPATLRLHGGFEQDDLPALVCAIRPHLAWFPAMAPETYGFALSDAMLLGLPILARGLGAYPERLAGRAFTWVVPGTASNGAAAWVARLEALRRQGLVQEARIEGVEDGQEEPPLRRLQPA